ncbi:carboxymuconolactone decarboxylase family protein [Halomonas caseinilytica]|uniref:carboxymuconolactone decarboxylase family protein n=1 Tax=Halomonas caseinilytica TaxID=438744 RepID=UPI0008492982|nr:carboxymuconolactone decarboxylase family protein [Halomonas caseinilytica]
MEEQQLPSAAGTVAERHPQIWKAYAELGKTCAEAGPLDATTTRLVKLALAIGVGSEGAVHSHTRRALEESVPPEALKHVALLSILTIGFSQAVAALTWIEDITDPA